MRAFAYCTELAARAVQAAVGVAPFTSPPFTAETFNVRVMERRDLLYFRLHGVPGHQGVWYGEGPVVGRVPALRASQLDGLDLGGAIVFVANCYGTDDATMAGALYRAGAGAVIAGPGANIAAANRVVGTDLLAKWLLRFLRGGLPLVDALRWAKARLKLTSWRDSDKDALAFDILQRQEV